MTNPERDRDPRIEQLVKLVHELIIERAQMGMDAFKEDGHLGRAVAFFEDAKRAQEALDKLLEAFGE